MEIWFGSCQEHRGNFPNKLIKLEIKQRFSGEPQKHQSFFGKGSPI